MSSTWDPARHPRGRAGNRGQFAPAARHAAQVALETDDPYAVTDDGTTAGDPAELFPGMGVYTDDYDDLVRVNHFMYGTFSTSGDYLAHGRRVSGLSRWSVERLEGDVPGGDGETAMAERLWGMRHEISALVRANGGEARLRVKAHEDGSVTISEYDWSAWTHRLPAGQGSEPHTPLP